MAHDYKTLLKIIRNEVEGIDPLYDGYHEELLEAVTDIIYKESQHMEQAIYIQKEILEIIKKVAKQISNINNDN